MGLGASELAAHRVGAHLLLAFPLLRTTSYFLELGSERYRQAQVVRSRCVLLGLIAECEHTASMGPSSVDDYDLPAGFWFGIHAPDSLKGD